LSRRHQPAAPGDAPDHAQKDEPVLTWGLDPAGSSATRLLDNADSETVPVEVVVPTVVTPGGWARSPEAELGVVQADDPPPPPQAELDVPPTPVSYPPPPPPPATGSPEGA